MPLRFLATAAILALSSVPAAAQGRWLASYPEVQGPVHAEMRTALQQGTMLESMVDPLNEAFLVPRDITVEMAECGGPAATYDASRATVRVCYELLLEFADQAESGDMDNETFEQAFAFILLHQVGHAVIDVLKLNVGVPEEEAADQFVAVMAGLAPGELQGLLQGAAALHEQEFDWESPDSGQTTLGDRRLTTLTCLLYGGDPEAHRYLVEGGHLTTARADSCLDAHEDLQEAWATLLEGHLVEG
ncbi:DUF4344 domain-containing metallopeptidase [Longimicrobium sp.]|jgi:hypothetical protein|uniref:DUF4344 domain-containing metallopeptidase n=1 Tax=Longimicrobium sp. TaxID=2029185 RepID=UPI002F92B9D3